MIKKVVKRILFGHLSSSEEYIKYLKKMGVRIGEGTNFIDPKSTLVDLTRPWMIEIGQSVCITGGSQCLHMTMDGLLQKLCTAM